MGRDTGAIVPDPVGPGTLGPGQGNPVGAVNGAAYAAEVSTRANRTVGDDLTPDERELLRRLSAGSGEQSALLREQLTVATWGGYEHASCECFLLHLAPDVPLPRVEHDGGPFAVLEVADGTVPLGMLELWVVDGLAHSVTYMPFGGDHARLPTPQACALEPVE